MYHKLPQELNILSFGVCFWFIKWCKICIHPNGLDLLKHFHGILLDVWFLITNHDRSRNKWPWKSNESFINNIRWMESIKKEYVCVNITNESHLFAGSSLRQFTCPLNANVATPSKQTTAYCKREWKFSLNLHLIIFSSIICLFRWCE